MNVKTNLKNTQKITSKKLFVNTPIDRKIFKQKGKECFDKLSDVKVRKNVTYGEYKKIANDEYKSALKTLAIVTSVIAGSVTAMFLALKSGKFDKQLNAILSIKEKATDLLNEKFQINFKKEIKNILNFDKAKVHFEEGGKLNNNKQVSGAHEVREFINILIKQDGNIISMKPSNTDNGIWEIIYEIDGKISDTPKSVYKSTYLSDVDIKNLSSLIRKNKNIDLLKAITHFKNDKIVIPPDEMEKYMQEALADGCVIEKKADSKQVKAAKSQISILAEKLKNISEIENIQSEIQKENERWNQIAKNTPNAQKKEQAFQELLKAHQEKLKNLKSNLKNYGVADTRRKDIDTEEIRANLEQELKNKKLYLARIQKPCHVFGERDGKLFGAFAHYEKNKVVVDSYFPIAHGSKMQQEFVRSCLNQKLFTLNNVKCLIGAKKSDINKYGGQQLEKLKKSVKSGKIIKKGAFSLGTCLNFKISSKISKLNKERENNLNKTA